MDDSFMLMGGDADITTVNNEYDIVRDPTVPITDPTAANILGDITDPTSVLTKTRKPMVKLTAEKLLSDKGLPYLMKNGPKRLYISKRKNAHDNFSQILQFYQLWAHELYPKAKFKDFIKLCQTLGKNDRVLREYRMDLYRKEMDIRTGTDLLNDFNNNMPITGLQAGTTDIQYNNNDVQSYQNQYENTTTDIQYDEFADGDNNNDTDEIYSVSTNVKGRKVVSESSPPSLIEQGTKFNEIIHESHNTGNKRGNIPEVQSTEEADLINEWEREQSKLAEENLDTQDNEFNEDIDALEAMMGMGF